MTQKKVDTTEIQSRNSKMNDKLGDHSNKYLMHHLIYPIKI
jgi:hypothetical protein